MIKVINDWKNILYDNEEKTRDCIEPIYSFWTTLENGIHEYIEYYAKECLKIAAEQAYMSRNGIGMIMNTGRLYNCEINKDSILNIKLPEHE